MAVINSYTSIRQMPGETLKEFLAKVRDNQTDRLGRVSKSPRRVAAQSRIDIAKNDFSHLVEDRIEVIWGTKEIQNEIKNMAKMSLINPLINITNAVTTAYNVPPTRMLRDEKEEVNNKFSALLEEGMIAIQAKQWLELAFINNVVIVVPTVRQLPLGPKLIWDMHLPNNTEVIPQASDPTQPAIMGTTYGELVCVLDAEAWWYFNEKNELVSKIDHNLGIFPGTAFRLACPMGDFWDETRGQNVVFGTIEIARLYAELNWIRKTQSRKIPAVIAQNLEEDVPAGQVFHPEQPFEAQTDDPQNFRFEIKDFVTPITEFSAHMRLIYAELCESYGIHSTIVDLDSSVQGAQNTTALGQAVHHSKLAEIREDHVQWLRIAEKDLIWKTMLMASVFEHPLRLDPAMVKDKYEVVWGPLSFVDHPQVKIAYQRDRIQLGVESPVDIILDDHPNWSREQAIKWMEMIADEKRVIAEFHAEHNLPADQVDANMTIAQQQGQLGGLSKDEDNSNET